MSEPTTNEIELGLVDSLLADLGTMYRRHEAETLTEEEGRDLLNRMRADLRSLRACLQAEDGEEPIVLTDAGNAALMALSAAQRPAFREAVRRSQRLMTGRALMERDGVDRARFYGDLAVIDGDRT